MMAIEDQQPVPAGKVDGDQLSFMNAGIVYDLAWTTEAALTMP